MFDSTPHSDFDGGRVVLRHELGHVVIWFHYGESIGPIYIETNPKGEIANAKAVLWPRDGNRRWMDCSSYAERLAERWLAGEACARRMFKNMPTNQIGTNRIAVDAGSEVQRVLDRMSPNEDVARVLYIANLTVGPGWFEWVRDRLVQVNRILDENWPAIQAIANRLERKLPKPGGKLTIFGTDLIAHLKSKKVQSLEQSAVELVYGHDVGNLWVQLKRRYRSLGSKKATTCIYANKP